MINNGQLVMPVFHFVREIIFDDEDEDNNVIEKIDNFPEQTVPLMRDREFQSHFRMFPETFEDLLMKIHITAAARNIPLVNRIGFPRTCLEKELMITIWFLGNIESFRSVANRFGVSKSTCWEIVRRVCLLLLQVNQHCRIISWPNQARQISIANEFEIYGFQGIVGCIDGSHIPIVAPQQSPNSYVNRKGYHSLLLQGVCDDRMLFTDVYAGEAGSLHDYTLYRRSPLYRAIQGQQVRFFDQSHLLGDLAYKLAHNLMVGFKDNGRLTVRQRNFNIILSKIRVKIENTFALLKGRFRRLKSLEATALDIAVLTIMGACILHNICILNGETFAHFIDMEQELRAERENDPHNVEDDFRGQEPIGNNAVMKRNNFVNNLPVIIAAYEE